mmetsp:Transcript_22021/g.71186  ORF Transcript_22021/g.71186 Transcript_22021/m.71186 type:complete len:477 (+) Transcript_22021:116-1546(+)
MEMERPVATNFTNPMRREAPKAAQTQVLPQQEEADDVEEGRINGSDTTTFARPLRPLEVAVHDLIFVLCMSCAILNGFYRYRYTVLNLDGDKTGNDRNEQAGKEFSYWFITASLPMYMLLVCLTSLRDVQLGMHVVAAEDKDAENDGDGGGQGRSGFAESPLEQMQRLAGSESALSQASKIGITIATFCATVSDQDFFHHILLASLLNPSLAGAREGETPGTAAMTLKFFFRGGGSGADWDCVLALFAPHTHGCGGVPRPESGALHPTVPRARTGFRGFCADVRTADFVDAADLPRHARGESHGKAEGRLVGDRDRHELVQLWSHVQHAYNYVSQRVRDRGRNPRAREQLVRGLDAGDAAHAHDEDRVRDVHVREPIDAHGSFVRHHGRADRRHVRSRIHHNVRRPVARARRHPRLSRFLRPRQQAHQPIVEVARAEKATLFCEPLPKTRRRSSTHLTQRAHRARTQGLVGHAPRR